MHEVAEERAFLIDQAVARAEVSEQLETIKQSAIECLVGSSPDMQVLCEGSVEQWQRVQPKVCVQL